MKTLVTVLVASLFVANGSFAKEKKPRKPASKATLMTCMIKVDSTVTRSPKSQEFSRKLEPSILNKLIPFEISYQIEGRMILVKAEVVLSTDGFTAMHLSFPFSAKTDGGYFSASTGRLFEPTRTIALEAAWEENHQNPVQASAECKFE